VAMNTSIAASNDGTTTAHFGSCQLAGVTVE
jgi:hypothetical protein